MEIVFSLKGRLMGKIDDFVNDGFSSRGSESRECVTHLKSHTFYLTRDHKITKQAYDGMYVAQRGCCVICGKHQSEFKNRLAVDHSHKTGKIRGLLCITCNAGLGMFQDNPQILANAIEYLKGSE